MSSEVAVRETIEMQVAQELPTLGVTLPSSLDEERFVGLVAQAVKASPQLIDAFASQQGRQSLILAAHQCAAIGLEPNTPLQHAWLLPRRRKQITECQLQIGYKGLLHLARNSGQVKTIFAEVVRQNDVFEFERGLEKDHFRHRPAPTNRGELYLVYAVVRYTNGGYDLMVLDRQQVEKRRAKSDSFGSKLYSDLSPWKQWEEEMWRKTALKALCHMLPLSADVALALTVDDATFRSQNGVVIPSFEASDDPIIAEPTKRVLRATNKPQRSATVTMPPRQTAPPAAIKTVESAVLVTADQSKFPEGIRIKDTDSEQVRAAKTAAQENLLKGVQSGK